MLSNFWAIFDKETYDADASNAIVVTDDFFMNLNRKQLIALEDLDETSTEPEHTQAVGVKETKESFWPFHKLDNLSADLYEVVSECGRGYVVLKFL